MGKGVIFFEREMIKSPAFSKLRGKAVNVLLIFFSKRVMKKISIGNRKKQWACVNNGKITFYYREADEKYDIAYSTFSNAIDQLVELGFIDITQPGIGYARIATLYAISERWRKYGTDEFKKATRKKRFNYKFPKKK